MNELIRKQYAAKDAVEAYQKFLLVNGQMPILEDDSIEAWLCQKLAEHVQAESLIGDFGCGMGRLRPVLRTLARQVLGVDQSREMLSRIPVQSAEDISLQFAPLQIGAIKDALASGKDVFLEASLEEFLPQIAQQGIFVDAALNCYNAVCFPHPSIVVSAIGQCLKSGGQLFFVSNVFVPASRVPRGKGDHHITLSQSEYFATDNCEGMMFRQLFPMPKGDLTFQDYVHDMGMIKQAFNSEDWQIEEIVLYDSEGRHLKSDDPEFAERFAGLDNASFLEPDSGLNFCRLGVLARKA
jgi:SAM-dependent methyltransferase